MGLFDKLKAKADQAEKALADHPDQVKAALAKAGAAVDRKTGGTHHKQIAEAEAKAEGFIEKQVKKP